MKCTFDKAKLLSLLKDFNALTKATISIWDSDFNQILVYPTPIPLLCGKIKGCRKGNKMCHSSDVLACLRATNTKKHFSYTCHAGLVDTVVPVSNKGEIIAYIMFGQIRDAEEEYSSLENVKKLCKKYDIDEKEIEKDYNSLFVLTHRQIDAAAHFLKMCTSYIYMSQMIKIEKNELALEIDDYITKNLAQILTVAGLCSHLKISKNTLYETSHKCFNTTIKNYIISRRIDEAKRLLTTSALSIPELSGSVGIGDYNYFIRLFKSRVNYTPLKYRKLFSKILVED